MDDLVRPHESSTMEVASATQPAIELTERRAKDRELMAKAIESLAQEMGVKCERGHPPLNDRAILMSLTAPRGLCVSVELDGKSIQPDIHVLPWHIDYESQARLSPSFGEVNTYHFRKATQVARGFSGLMANLRRGFSAAKDGSAFQD